MISDFIKSMIGVAVVVVVIVAVAVPIISDIAAPRTETYDNGDSVARYSKYDDTSTVTIRIDTRQGNEYGISINGNLIYDFNGVDSFQFPIVVSKYFTIIFSKVSINGNFAYYMANPEDIKTVVSMNGTYLILTISDGTITDSSYKIETEVEDLWIYDPDGDYGVYWADGLNSKHVIAADDDDVIQFCTMHYSGGVLQNAFIKLNNGEVVDSYYFNCSDVDYPLILDSIADDGIISYGFVSIEPTNDTPMNYPMNFVLAPMEITIIHEPTPTVHMITLIPIIMIAGLIIGVAGTFLYRRLS